MIGLDVAILIFIYGSAYLSAIPAVWIVKQYHLKKPLGMQTFFGQTNVVLAHVFIAQGAINVGLRILKELSLLPQSHFAAVAIALLGIYLQKYLLLTKYLFDCNIVQSGRYIQQCDSQLHGILCDGDKVCHNLLFNSYGICERRGWIILV